MSDVLEDSNGLFVVLVNAEYQHAL
ncbi:MbtH family NRPS accessory protein [Mycetohabitans sp. B4]|nr:MbtH family NRPS accessory protein [Mycetohabitans sp. B4]